MPLLLIKLLLLFVVSCPINANANITSNDSSTNQAKTILTVAISEDGYYPFYTKESNIISGFSIDVIRYMEAHSKYDFEFVFLPWPRALKFVEQGKVDIILTLFKTDIREGIYHFIEPAYANEINQLFTLTDNKINFSGQLTQLAPYTIGMLREYSYGKTFDQAQYLNKLPVLTEGILLKLLLGKRIDMLIGNPFLFNRILEERKIKDRVIGIKPYVATTPVYMAITRNRADSNELKQTLSQLIQRLKQSDDYHKLLSQYKLNF
ncbi:transporter substrate-binding domain-containing protein [Thalassotalea sp. G2M2-11]|uniref:substrate-binding periplasmic protein n=1 Tax=Thalassotalea sp. G2M2-11 TaxID=2787627 RepID=UPI0019CFC8BF|nr:transporter substrate-binding domain-containing protein [Thalassotalea sp. G2M2-11]